MFVKGQVLCRSFIYDTKCSIHISVSMSVKKIKCFFACVCLHEWICVVELANKPPCVPVYTNLCAPIFVYYSEAPPPALWYTNTQTQTFTHKQLELNEAELSLVPISLIINNFFLPPNTLINLQSRLHVCVCVSICACQCLCTSTDKRCGW